jgi:hypothetical protein
LKGLLRVRQSSRSRHAVRGRPRPSAPASPRRGSWPGTSAGCTAGRRTRYRPRAAPRRSPPGRCASHPPGGGRSTRSGTR